MLFVGEQNMRATMSEQIFPGDLFHDRFVFRMLLIMLVSSLQSRYFYCLFFKIEHENTHTIAVWLAEGYTAPEA